jgi:MazG family protein
MTTYQLDDLLHIMRRLRNECPWDKAQTPQSLTRYAIEEAYEVEAAIQSGNRADIRDELGDLLLQVVFQSQLFSETGAAHNCGHPDEIFDFYDVVNGLAHKLIRRHPHVFGSDDSMQASATSQTEVNQLWEQVKQTERMSEGKSPRRRLDDVKPGPALMQAQDLQKQAAKLGFDWPDVQGVKDKLTEELAELEQAILSEDKAHIEDELGDCFFALINVARKLNIHSETALLGTIHKFRQRFAYIEDQLAAQGKTPEQSNLQEMDVLWEQAKVQLKK